MGRDPAALLVTGLGRHAGFGVGAIDASGLEPRQPDVAGRLTRALGPGVTR
jgi:hypothetical protein